MKKSLTFLLLFLGITFTSQASFGSTEKASFGPSPLACGTGSSSASSTCWTLTVTVTYCCEDCSVTEATVMATLYAGNDVRANMHILALLDELSPCDEEQGLPNP